VHPAVEILRQIVDFDVCQPEISQVSLQNQNPTVFIHLIRQFCEASSFGK
jgi:hypothetical protein